MTMTALDIRSFDLRRASDPEYAALSDFWNVMRFERVPDDPPVPLEERVPGWRMIPEREHSEAWAVWESNQIVAFAEVEFDALAQENTHLVWANLAVRPSHRRQGMARALLERVVEVPVRVGRRLIVSGTSDRAPAGEALMNRLGAKKALEAHLNQLLVEDLDRDLLRRWIDDGPSERFELGLWDGPYPEDQLERICQLMDVMNTAPRGDLEMEDWKVTPDQLRDWQRQLEASGTVRWTVYATDRTTSEFVGYTETGWNPNRPEILGQWGTGVFPQYRGHGLGKWLKAAMLERALRERPTITKVRTGNADSNAPMLKINHALGFKPFIADAEWQLEVSKVLEYLGR
jgi:mycothiol synthase